ncbi:MAG: outer membrane lipoprotein-sorting protein [Opitutaceae bacterium]
MTSRGTQTLVQRLTGMPWARLVFAFGLGLQMAGAAVPASPPELAQVGKPDEREAARLIEQFRTSGIPGEYFLEFELRSLPRRGESRTFKGRWWGSRNDSGAITRIELTDATGNRHRFLLQNGERAAVWRLGNGRPVEVGIGDLMTPLIPGVEISAFDLQMPYLYWPGTAVERITRVLGRPAHAFVFPAPAAFKAKHPDISAARAYLDTQFNVPMQSEIIGRNGRVIKTWAVLSLKNVDHQTLPKSVDYRNETTRDKTRLQVTGAALNLQLPDSLFQPASLGQPGDVPLPDRIVRINP